jgi:rod shape-determining protein MreD
MPRIAVTFLTLFLLWLIVAQVNHALSDIHVYLFVGGLFVTYSALSFRLRDGLIVSFLGGLLCDASMPLAPGLSGPALTFAHTHTLLFLCAHVVVFRLRDRIPRNETAARVLVALFTNLAVFLLFSFVHITQTPAAAEAWPRIIVDLACSQVFLALIAPWFFALQTSALVLARVERETLAGTS